MTDTNGYALLPLAWYADYLSVFRFAKDGGISSTYNTLVHFRLSGENISSRDSENNLIKIEAQNQYRDAVAQMLQGHPDADMLYSTMNWVLRKHLKYNLKHTPRKVFWHLFCHRKQYRVHSRDIWQVFWSNAN